MAGETEQRRRPPASAFKQQTLSAWQPILTPGWVIGTFLVVAIVFLPIGGIVLDASTKVAEHSWRYDAHCSNKLCAADSALKQAFGTKTCEPRGDCGEVTLELPEMKGPVYIYYQLTNFYQNHRRYVKSRSDRQLRGEDGLTPTSGLADCEPKVTTTANGADYNIYPCGLIADSMFNDTFGYLECTGTNAGRRYIQSTNSQGTNDKIWIKETDIAWSSDKDKKFDMKKFTSEPVSGRWDPKACDETCTQPVDWLKCAGVAADNNYQKYTYVKAADHPGNENVALLNMASNFQTTNYELSEHFVVWMRTAGLPTFKKLWGVIDDDLKAGTYKLKIGNQFDVYKFKGEKAIIFSTTTWIGGKNDFLGIAYIVVGAICLALAGGFYIKHRISPRKLGDPQYLVWNQDRT
eukprot:GFYU01002533.1.p2 GENE.GFYU01002533.1~~GFYU01002533.1.p2  ORF type:complete len:406 (-),score=156.31 GFYU01002533.1:432-1649(-)